MLIKQKGTILWPEFIKLSSSGAASCILCHVSLCNSVACQAPCVHGILQQEYWSGLPFFSSKGSFQPRD